MYKDGKLVRCQVWFVPNVTINCSPAFVRGKKDSRWIKYREKNKPKSKEELENCIGMSIQSWD